MTKAPFGVVSRVTHVKLEGFRGFKRSPEINTVPLEIDTDADLVLISGPNGHGKTSLLEALTLLLTGWHAHASDNDLISRHPVKTTKAAKTASEDGTLYQRAAVRIEGLTAQKTPCALDAVILKDKAVELSRTGLEDPSEARRIADPELKARLTTFFQDRLGYLFDEASTGRTFRDTFETIPKEVEDLQAWVNNAKAVFKGEIEQRDKTDALVVKQRTEGLPKLQAAWEKLVGTLRQLAEEPKVNWPRQAPAIPDQIGDETALDAFARALVEALEGRRVQSEADGLRTAFSNAIKRFIQLEIDRAQRAAGKASDETRRLLEERDQAKQDIREIEARRPNLDEDLRRFASDQADLPDALAVFRALARNSRGWSVPPDEAMEPLKQVCAELGKVDSAAADKCAEALANWLEPRRHDGLIKQNLTNRLPELEQKIEQSLVSQVLEKLRSIKDSMPRKLENLEKSWRDRHRYRADEAGTEKRAEARLYLSQITEALDKVVEAKLNEMTQPSEALLKDVSDRIRNILWRFQLVEGILPLQLKPEPQSLKDSEGHERTRLIYNIRTDDGRLLQDLSTGQRAQVGVSLLVAQNLAATRLLNHRIILLDDVTTAYDLSNLTREAILWRQFAYGADDGSDQKRQIFISSHHEDMTNHLLDLLVPPPGGTMRLIRFTDWSNTDGPEIETFQVEPGEGVSNTTLKAALAAF